MSDELRYFEALFAGRPAELAVVVWVKHGDSKRTTYALSPESAAQTARTAQGDVYAGAGYAPKGFGRAAGASRRRPGKAQVAGIAGLWADLDVNGGPEGKTGAAPDRETALALAGALLAPSMLVDSGYGVQAYWLLDKPWVFADATERQQAQELEARWLAALAGQVDWRLDATHDLSRVLRVPGTHNLKGGLQAPVRLLDLADARYAREDFASHVASVQLSLHPAANGANADDITVEVREHAEPPFEKFAALAEVDELFASAWARQRQDARSGEWSASEWDMALADRAVRARWADQELADLMVAARRRHGDALKGPDYYARTIARARATIDVAHAEARRQEAIAELTAPPVSAADDDPGHVLSLFEQVVGVPLLAFRQYGRDPDEGGIFELELAGPFAGQKIRIPDAEVLLAPQKVRARVATVTGLLPPPCKRDEWDAVVRRLLRARDLQQFAGEDAAGVLAGWLHDYLAGGERGGERVESLRHGWPHVHDGALYISRGGFQSWLRTSGERVTRRELQAMLKAAGFVAVDVSYRRPDGASSTASLYTRPVQGAP